MSCICPCHYYRKIPFYFQHCTGTGVGIPGLWAILLYPMPPPVQYQYQGEKSELPCIQCQDLVCPIPNSERWMSDHTQELVTEYLMSTISIKKNIFSKTDMHKTFRWFISKHRAGCPTVLLYNYIKIIPFSVHVLPLW